MHPISLDSSSTRRNATVAPNGDLIVPGGWVIHRERRIGNGTWSVVYHCTSPSGVPCAAKVIAKSKLKPHETQFPYVEVSALRQLQHKHVVRLLHDTEDDTNHYLFLQLVSGHDLFSFLEKNRRMNERFARRVFAQLADAVHQLHHLGIVHRDLKLENVLLSHTGVAPTGEPAELHVTLLDFGLAAQLRTPYEKLSDWCGSPLYASVELINKIAYRTEVDVWALGIILYCMVAGYQPFYGKQVSDIFAKIRGQRLEFPEHFSPALRDLLTRMLDRDSSRRITLSQILIHEWVMPVCTKQQQQQQPPPPQPTVLHVHVHSHPHPGIVAPVPVTHNSPRGCQPKKSPFGQSQSPSLHASA